MTTRQVYDKPIRFDNYGQQLSVNAETGEYVALNINKRFREILIEPTGTGTCDTRFSLSPKVNYVYWYDASATSPWVLIGKNSCSCDDCIFDSGKSTARTVTAMAAADYLYISPIDRIRGFYFDLTALNNNAATMAADYNTTQAFVTVGCVTDGTIATCATFGADGDFLIDTVPADTVWVPGKLSTILGTTADGLPGEVKDVDRYWIRLSPSALLDNVSIVNLVTIHACAATGCTKGTDAGAGWFTKVDQEYQIPLDDCVGGFTAVSSGGTARTVNVSWISRR